MNLFLKMTRYSKTNQRLRLLWRCDNARSQRKQNSLNRNDFLKLELGGKKTIHPHASSYFIIHRPESRDRRLLLPDAAKVVDYRIRCLSVCVCLSVFCLSLSLSSLLHALLHVGDGAQASVDVLQIVAPNGESVVKLLPLDFAEGADLRRRNGHSLVYLIHFASHHPSLDHLDDEIFHIFRRELEMEL